MIVYFGLGYYVRLELVISWLEWLDFLIRLMEIQLFLFADYRRQSLFSKKKSLLLYHKYLHIVTTPLSNLPKLVDICKH